MIALKPDANGKVSFQSVPQFTRTGSYAVDYDWRDLEDGIKGYVERYDFDMGESDFQRSHVWTEAQQIAYVEFVLRGGRTGMDIHCNCAGWQGLTSVGRMELVDGKQRLTAVLRFLRNEIGIFGGYRKSEFTGHVRRAAFRWHVNDLATRYGSHGSGVGQGARSSEGVQMSKTIRGIKPRFQGNPHRYADNPMELAYAEAWQRENDSDGSGRRDTLLAMLLGDGQTPSEPSEADWIIANRLIQWLGSPVGQHFVRDVLEKSK